MDLYHLAIVVVIGALNSGLAVVVLMRKPADRTHRAFARTVLLIVGWLVLAFLSDQPGLESVALELNRLTVGTGLLMGASLFHFVLVFPKPCVRAMYVWRTFIGTGLLLAALTATSPLFISGVGFRDSGTDVLAGPLYWLVAVWLGIGLLLMTFIVFTKYRSAAERERTQLKYVLLGLVMFAMVSLVQGLLFPMLTGSYETARLNLFSSLLLVASATYAMAAHRFMDIRFVVMRGVGYSILLVLLSAAVVTLVLSVQSGVADWTGLSPSVMLVASCLVTVFIFQPLKHLTEHVTDRLFYRKTYDPDELLHRLGTAVLSTLDRKKLAGVVAEGLALEMRLAFAATLFTYESETEFSSSADTFSQIDALLLLNSCSNDGLCMTDELDSSSDIAMLLRDADVRMLIPLGTDEHRIGAIFLGMKQSGSTFSNRDVRFLETIARETTIAARNAQLFDERNRRVAELTAINELSRTASANQEVAPILDQALTLLGAVTGADSGSVMLLDDAEGVLRMASSTGLPQAAARNAPVPVGKGVSGWVAEKMEALLLVDDTDPRFRSELTRQEIACAISAPVVFNRRVAGVINVNRHRSNSCLFTRDDLDFVRSFAAQLATALENTRLYHDLQRTFLGTISALAAAVDAKDPYTYGHSNWVTRHATAIAKGYGLTEAEIETIRIASILHDIGKIGIDGAILRKPDALTDEEREIVRRHPAIGADILASLDFLQDAVPLILFHHEHFRGGGYPSGISGAAIPLGARIIAVADAYDAMTSDRPYRKALSAEEAVQELRDHAGVQFDPNVVKAFLAVLADEDEQYLPIRVTPCDVLPFPLHTGSLHSQPESSTLLTDHLHVTSRPAGRTLA